VCDAVACTVGCISAPRGAALPASDRDARAVDWASPGRKSQLRKSPMAVNMAQGVSFPGGIGQAGVRGSCYGDCANIRISSGGAFFPPELLLFNAIFEHTWRSPNRGRSAHRHWCRRRLGARYGRCLRSALWLSVSSRRKFLSRPRRTRLSAHGTREAIVATRY